MRRIRLPRSAVRAARAPHGPLLSRSVLPRAPPLLRAPAGLACRELCGSNSNEVLRGKPSDSDLIGRWMNDETLVDPVGWGKGSIGVFRRMEMYVTLHLMPGFDLPDFLAGTRVAYGAVTRLMYARDWEALEPLVSDACLEAMRWTMEELAGDARRIVGTDEADAIDITSATLNRVLLPDDPDFVTGSPRKVHLDVRFVSMERWVMHDYHTNAPIAPFDGTPFEQTSTMRWEGEVAPPDSDAEVSSWRLIGLV